MATHSMDGIYAMVLRQRRPLPIYTRWATSVGTMMCWFTGGTARNWCARQRKTSRCPYRVREFAQCLRSIFVSVFFLFFGGWQTHQAKRHVVSMLSRSLWVVIKSVRFLRHHCVEHPRQSHSIEPYHTTDWRGPLFYIFIYTYKFVSCSTSYSEPPWEQKD